MKKARNSDGIVSACREVGGQSVMARHLKVSPPTVNQWVKESRPVPPGRCLAIERATKGKVTCECLRPDLDWTYLRAMYENIEKLCIDDHQTFDGIAGPGNDNTYNTGKESEQ